MSGRVNILYRNNVHLYTVFRTKFVDLISSLSINHMLWQIIQFVMANYTKLYGKHYKRPVYIFAFGEFNFQQVNGGGIQYFLAQI